MCFSPGRRVVRVGLEKKINNKKIKEVLPHLYVFIHKNKQKFLDTVNVGALLSAHVYEQVSAGKGVTQCTQLVGVCVCV